MTNAILLIFIAHLASVTASNIFVHSNASDVKSHTTDLTEAKAPVCSDEAGSERCEWVAAEISRAVKYRDLKNSNRSWDKCDLSCGRCCKDEPPTSKLSFTINGKAQKCDWLSKNIERARKHCKKKPVYVQCPKTCGVCCEDNYSYNLVTKDGEETERKCSFVTTAKLRKKFCKGPKNKKNAENCGGSCSCKNLSGRKQVPQLGDRFPCETQIKEMRAPLNRMLLQEIGDNYNDSCKREGGNQSPGMKERFVSCDYKDLTKNIEKKCNNAGGDLYELKGRGVCTEADGKPKETLDLITDDTSYNGIHMCIPPKCDIQEITKGLKKHERFSRGCGLIELYLLNTEQPTPSPISGEPTPSSSDGGSGQPTPSTSDGGSDEPTGGSGGPTPSDSSSGTGEPTPSDSSSGTGEPTPVSSSLGPT